MRFKEIKRQANNAQAKNALEAESKDRLFAIREGQKQVYQMVEYMKRRSEDERKDLDTHNLTL
jgi:hypothetical protein